MYIHFLAYQITLLSYLVLSIWFPLNGSDVFVHLISVLFTIHTITI